MVRKQRKRISYVLPLPDAAGGHRLGVNGLAIDSDNSILYSGGRDGVICAWDVNLNLSAPRSASVVDSASIPPSTPTAASSTGQQLTSSYNVSNSPHRGPSPSSSSTAARGISSAPPTTLRQQFQAHTHWINDIALVHGNQALVSASSDVTVKLWRPTAHGSILPVNLGLHSDYVKCVTSPGSGHNWVASGGLDRKVYLWDLYGGGEKLKINVGSEEAANDKGSVYALAATGNVIAGGGPESIVRVWDARNAQRIMKFVGHTDNIRSVLIADDGETVMSASSDQTVKIWSMTAGRCMYTLTMHSDSVWSLYSDHPRLEVFWSSDRSGVIAKTDARGKAEVDEGLCVAVCQETGGVGRVVASGGYLWTATSSSSINRWADVSTDDAEVLLPETYSMYQRSSVSTYNRSRIPSQQFYQAHHVSGGDSPRFTTPTPARKNSVTISGNQIPLKSVLRLSNTAPFPIFRTRDIDTSTLYSTNASLRKTSEAFAEPDDVPGTQPLRSQPDFTIEGQHGLIKHITLADKRRVLTLDTAGDVLLWDILKCKPVEAFGKRDIDDVFSEVNTMETVAHWCSVDTRTGSLTCVLEENNCFDAEMYADELDIEEEIDFKEDQRINLGKWILRYLFDNLIDEEIVKDEEFRHSLLQTNYPQLAVQERQLKRAPPGSIQIPSATLTSWLDTSSAPNSSSTLRATNGFNHLVHTPSFGIGVATPAVANPPPLPTNHPVGLMPIADVHSQGEGSQRNSTDRQSNDYFSTQPSSPTASGFTPGGTQYMPHLQTVLSTTPSSSANARNSQDHSHAGDSTATAAALLTPGSPDPDSTPASAEKSGHFAKKFMRGMNFMSKGKKTAQAAETKTPAAEEAASDAESRSSRNEERVPEDSFQGQLLQMRKSYEAQVAAEKQSAMSPTTDGSRPLNPSSMLNPNGLPAPQNPPRTGNDIFAPVQTLITPSLPNETPVLKPPASTIILIQVDRPDSGGVADLWGGNVGSAGQDSEMIEQVAPSWLFDVLLRNQLPLKDVVKVSFVLEPWQGLLPVVSTDGNTRLNANRMLRARKILAYVAERIEPVPAEDEEGAMKPEEYMELYCQNQLVPPTMTLATIRAHVWRGGGDVLLYYKANGRKPVLIGHPPTDHPSAETANRL